MNAPTKRVWELARSLTISEIQKFYDRAFQKVRDGVPNYVKLFEAYKEHEVFDEEKLVTQYKNEQFTTHIHRTKSYLYDRILEFSREARRDGESELYALLDKIKFLFEKRLYHHLPIQFEKGIKLAKELDDFKGHIRVKHYERQLLMVQKAWKKYPLNSNPVIKSERRLLDKEIERMELTHLRDFLLGLPRHISVTKEIDSIEVELKQWSKPLSKTGSILVAQIRYMISLRTGEYLDCINETEKIIDILRENQPMIQEYENFKIFVMAVFYNCIFKTVLNDIPGSDETFELITSVANAPEREPVLFLERKLLHEFHNGIESSNWERVLAAVQHFNNLSDFQINQIDPTVLIEVHHSATVGLLIIGDQKGALNFILRIRGIKPPHARLDLKQYSRVLYLVAHYDLGNMETVALGVRSGRIALDRKNDPNSFYRAVFSMFSGLVRASSLEKREKSYQKFLSGFEVESEISWDSMNNYFNLKAWVNSKLNNREFRDVLIDGKPSIS